MPDSGGVNIEGAAGLIKAMNSIIDDLGPKEAFKAFKGGMKDATKPLATRIKANTPANTGVLRSRVRTVIRKLSRGEQSYFNGEGLVTSVSGFINLPTVEDIIKAYTLEYGTPYKDGIRILSNAIRAEQAGIFRIYSNATMKSIEKTLKKNRSKK